MSYFAEIKNNKVIRVIVSTQKIINKNYSGEWIETKEDNSIRKNFAGIGMSYNKQKDIFIFDKPFSSWSLDNNNEWKSPKEKPNLKDDFIWEELKQEWKKIIVIHLTENND
tara:strand:- start:83 stop:415 length:333 start_codon:yes stop_codon:yes gene_type:complete